MLRARVKVPEGARGSDALSDIDREHDGRSAECNNTRITTRRGSPVLQRVQPRRIGRWEMAYGAAARSRSWAGGRAGCREALQQAISTLSLALTELVGFFPKRDSQLVIDE